MLVEPDYLDVKRKMKWRYLDCLDSTRYSPTEFVDHGAPKQLRLEQASLEVIVTFLMGNGIIVPNNQLIDSVGFLRIASELIEVATDYVNQGKSVFVPMKYANYDYSHEATGGPHLRDPFSVAAYLFDKDGENDHGYFELSAWPELQSRRRDWAKALRSKALGVPPNLIKHQYEHQLEEDLFRVLNFFSNNPSLIIDAASTKGIREFMTSSVASLSKDVFETDGFFLNILSGQGASEYNKRLSRLVDIVGVFRKLREKGILDNRTEIRKELTANEAEYFDGIQGFVDAARVGVLKTFNSIYNFSGFKGTRAKQDNQTEPVKMDDEWGYEEAAFALGQWARENYEEAHKGIDATQDISSNQDSFVDRQVLGASFPSHRINQLWENFFDYQRSKEWETSLYKYFGSLVSFESAKNEYDRLDESDRTARRAESLMDTAIRYEEHRNHHIEVVNGFLPNNYVIQIIDEKAWLLGFDSKGRLVSKVQVEDFAEHATLSKKEKGSLYAKKKAQNISTKGRTAEYGE